MRFGGALWGNLIEFFYPGKKLRPGYAVQVNVVFDAPQQGKTGYFIEISVILTLQNHVPRLHSFCC